MGTWFLMYIVLNLIYNLTPMDLDFLLSHPDIMAALKIFQGKKRISGILFFDGEKSCLRSRHLVLWSLGTLTGQQKFYGSGLVT